MTDKVDKLQVVTEFLTQKVWFLGVKQGLRITGLTIKVEPKGFLGVVKALTAEGPRVAFIQAPTLETLYRELQHVDEIESRRWKVDQFALDNLVKNG